MYQQQITFQKAMWGKEKLLVTSNFSFSHNVFNSNVSPFVHTFEIISFFAVKLEEPKISTSGEALKSIGKCRNSAPEKIRQKLVYTEADRRQMDNAKIISSHPSIACDNPLPNNKF